MLVSVMVDGELRLYSADAESGSVDEWGRLIFAEGEQDHEALTRLSLDLARITGANGYAPERVATPRAALPAGSEPLPAAGTRLEPREPIWGERARPVWEELAAHGPMRAPEIGAATGLQTKVVSNALLSLKRQGHALKIGGYRWVALGRSVEPEPEAAPAPKRKRKDLSGGRTGRPRGGGRPWMATVHNVLAERGPMRTHAIGTALGAESPIDGRQIRSALRRLLDNGSVTRSGPRGEYLYALASAPVAEEREPDG